MRAAQYAGSGRLDVITMPLRPLGDQDVLVDVEACGICGTDIHIVEGSSRSAPPVVIGHEYFGTIVELGSGVKGRAIGDRVAVDPNIACGNCHYCRRGLVHLCSALRALGVDIDGGMAEYCVVPVSQLHPVSHALTATACVFLEPLSCAVHGIDRARINPGDSVVVVGGGPIGQIMVQLTMNSGAAATILVEPNQVKREIALSLGCTMAVNPAEVDVSEAVREMWPEGADAVIECAGLPSTAALALDLARRGGTVEFFGVSPIGATIPVEPNKIYFRELTIVGSYVNPCTFSRALALLEAGRVRVDAFPVARFPLEAVHDAFRHHREGSSLKSIIDP